MVGNEAPVKGKTLLIVAGCASTSIAMLHLAIIFVGAPGYRYFGAGDEMARLAAAGSPRPALLTSVITLFFAAFAAYAFSGARFMRRLPLLRATLASVASIYILRGLVVVPQTLALLSNSPLVAPKDVVFSAVSLFVGGCYLAGTIRSWKDLSPQRWRVA